MEKSTTPVMAAEARLTGAIEIPNPQAPIACIELIEIPANEINAFVANWNARAETLGQTRGYMTATLYRSLLSAARYQLIAITEWQSYDACRAASHGTANGAGGFYRPTAWSVNTNVETFPIDGNQTAARQGERLQVTQKDPEIKFPELPFVFINLMAMSAEDIGPFVADWRQRSKLMGQMRAALGTTLYRSVLPDNTYQIVNVSQWQSYDGFIDANNDPAYAQQRTTDLGHTPSIKLLRGFYRTVASRTHVYGEADEN